MLAPVLVGKTKQFKDPKAIIEIKMVAAPDKDDENIRKHLKDLRCQLRERKKKWPSAECFGLFLVRDLHETFPNSTSAFNGRIIKYKSQSLSSTLSVRQSVRVLARELNLRRVSQKCRVRGEDKIFRACVNLEL